MGVVAEGSTGRLSCRIAHPRGFARICRSAQEIFLEAFNHAWEQYAAPGKRHPGSSLEETANRVAWVAVKRCYVKVGDRWRPRDRTLTARRRHF